MLEHITIEPTSPAKKAVILLHGLGADGHDFAPIVPQLNLPDTRFILPHAPVQPVTINGGMAMPAWFDIHGFGLDSQIDWAGIEKSAQAAIKFIEAQVQAGIDYHNIYLAGFSQGGVVAIYTALRFAKKLAGVVGLSTFLPVHHPIECNAANQQTPFFLGHGSMDDIVPQQVGQLTAGWLQNKGYAVEWHEYPMAHQVCPQEIDDLGNWFRDN